MAKPNKDLAACQAWCKKTAEQANAEASRKRIAKQKDELLKKMLKADEAKEAERLAKAEHQRIKSAVKGKGRRKTGGSAP